MSLRGWLAGGTALAAVSIFCLPAWAQRADENAVTSAEDAFGTRVGNEGVGLYDMRSARGFDPQLAGNIRVEGLYFDVQGLFGNRLTRSTTMRIGLSAQSYPFPAPTGIADIAVHQPADRTIISPSVQYQAPTGMSSMTIDVSTPVVGDKLGMVFGVNLYRLDNEADTRSHNFTIAGLIRSRPTDNLEILTFAFGNYVRQADVAPSVFPAGDALPPEYDRDTFFGQEWADRKTQERNLGLIVRGNPSPNWRLQAGLFHSQQERPRNHVVFYRNVRADGSATLDILRYPEHYSGSYSGEVRASGVYTTGDVRHTVHIGARGRDTTRRFGGGAIMSFGPAQVGVYQMHPAPNYTLGVLDEDLVRQATPGVAYVGQWANVGEFSVGVQKSFYHRDFGKLGAQPSTTTSQPWLYNGTVAVNPTADLALYAGYTRGLEEFGTAPDNAANGGEPLPVKVTRQIDAGFRYRVMPGVNLIAGVFEVTKPYFDRNTANIYTVVGDVRHRGVEVSLAGKPAPNITVVAGAVFLQARVSGLPVDQGVIGPVPPGTPPSLYRFSLQYDLPQVPGLSFDTQIESNGSHYANRLNTLRVPSSETVALGVRYAFSVGETRTTFRAQVMNLLDSYNWTVEGFSGRLIPTPSRRFLARLSTDF